MFGTLKPKMCGLSEQDQKTHWRFYCGLCKGLGKNYGLAQRALVSYDAVFVSLIVDALSLESATEASCRCPMNPLVHRPTVADDSVPMRFASAISLLLSDQWLADRAEDGKPWAKASRRWLTPSLKKAQSLLTGLGIQLDNLQGFEKLQAKTEASTSVTLDQAAAPTAEALRLVFGEMSQLPGVTPLLQEQLHSRALSSLGQSLGRIIYFIDVLEDLEKDARRQEFNPCLNNTEDGPKVDLERVKDCRFALHSEFLRVREIFEVLPWQRHKAVLGNILGQLQGSSRRAAEQASQWLCRTGVVASASEVYASGQTPSSGDAVGGPVDASGAGSGSTGKGGQAGAGGGGGDDDDVIAIEGEMPEDDEPARKPDRHFHSSDSSGKSRSLTYLAMGCAGGLCFSWLPLMVNSARGQPPKDTSNAMASCFKAWGDCAEEIGKNSKGCGDSGQSVKGCCDGWSESVDGCGPKCNFSCDGDKCVKGCCDSACKELNCEKACQGCCENACKGCNPCQNVQCDKGCEQCCSAGCKQQFGYGFEWTQSIWDSISSLWICS